MSKIIERLGLALHKAIEEAPYQVKLDVQFQLANSVCNVINVHEYNKIVFSSDNVENAENECDRLNDLYVASEVMKFLLTLTEGDLKDWETASDSYMNVELIKKLVELALR